MSTLLTALPWGHWAVVPRGLSRSQGPAAGLPFGGGQPRWWPTEKGGGEEEKEGQPGRCMQGPSDQVTGLAPRSAFVPGRVRLGPPPWGAPAVGTGQAGGERRPASPARLPSTASANTFSRDSANCLWPRSTRQLLLLLKSQHISQMAAHLPACSGEASLALPGRLAGSDSGPPTPARAQLGPAGSQAAGGPGNPLRYCWPLCGPVDPPPKAITEFSS